MNRSDITKRANEIFEKYVKYFNEGKIADPTKNTEYVFKKLIEEIQPQTMNNLLENRDVIRDMLDEHITVVDIEITEDIEITDDIKEDVADVINDMSKKDITVIDVSIIKNTN